MLCEPFSRVAGQVEVPPGAAAPQRPPPGTPALFACPIIHTFQFIFSVRTVFFSHNKSANSIFSHDLSVKRTGPQAMTVMCTRRAQVKPFLAWSTGCVQGTFDVYLVPKDVSSVLLLVGFALLSIVHQCIACNSVSKRQRHDSAIAKGTSQMLMQSL